MWLFVGLTIGLGMNVLDRWQMILHKVLLHGTWIDHRNRSVVMEIHGQYRIVPGMNSTKHQKFLLTMLDVRVMGVVVVRLCARVYQTIIGVA